MSKRSRANKAAATTAETTALSVIDPIDGSIVEPNTDGAQSLSEPILDAPADDSIDAWLAAQIIRVAPFDRPKNPIGSNDVNVLRAVKPSKWAMLGRSDRVAMRDEAKRCYPELTAEAAVDRWLVETGNDSRTRLERAGYVLGVDFYMTDSLRAVVADAIMARAAGIRNAPLLAPRTPKAAPVTEPIIG